MSPYNYFTENNTPLYALTYYTKKEGFMRPIPFLCR